MRGWLAGVAGLLVVAGLAGCVGFDERALLPDGATLPALVLSPVVFDAVVRDTFDIPSSIDGVPLRVDVYRPPTEGPFPTILVLSPYWSFGGDAKADETPTWYVDYFVPRGYAVALGEMRGTRMSGGCWDFGGRLDQMDGHDLVEGLAAMPWSNGKVGMLGQSHVGMSQLAAAITNPPHLTTIVPIAAVSDWYRYLHKDGAAYVVNRGTPPAYFAVHASPANPEVGPESTSPDWVLAQAQTACMDNAVHLAKAADVDGDKDAYWQERDLIAGAPNVTASVFMVHGFLDENVKTDHFLDFWQGLPANVTRKAWFGQWFHEHPASDEGQFKQWREELHAWYDHWLLGVDNGILDRPRVTVQDNTGHGRHEADWPSAEARLAPQRWMLDGLEIVPETGGDDRVDYSYNAVPGDDRGLVGGVVPTTTSLDAWTAPLEQPLHLAGEVVLELEGSLSQPGGHWIAVLYDVPPGPGRDEISRSYFDAAHLEGLEASQDVQPGPHVYTLRFFPRDHVVPAGHRLALTFYGGDQGCVAAGAVASSTCEGTGILPYALPVTHTIHTGPGSLTRLLLPVPSTLGPEAPLTPMDGWLDDLPP